MFLDHDRYLSLDQKLLGVHKLIFHPVLLFYVQQPHHTFTVPTSHHMLPNLPTLAHNAPQSPLPKSVSAPHHAASVLFFSWKWGLPPQNPNSLCFSFSAALLVVLCHTCHWRASPLLDCASLPIPQSPSQCDPGAQRGFLRYIQECKNARMRWSREKSWSMGRISLGWLSTGSWTLSSEPRSCHQLRFGPSLTTY